MINVNLILPESTISGISKCFHWFLWHSWHSWACWTSSFFLFSLYAWNHIINSEKQAACLNWSFDDLIFHSNWFPNIYFIHITNFLTVSINSKGWITCLSMFSSKLSDNSHNIHSTVSCKCFGNDFKGVSNWIRQNLPALKGSC